MVTSPPCFFRLILGLSIFSGGIYAQDESWEVDWKAIENVTKSLAAQVDEDFLSSEQLESWAEQALTEIQELLRQTDVGDLRAYAPYVREVLDYLHQFPEAKPWFDWLTQRFDYFEYPSPLRSAPPVERVAPRPRPAPPNPSGPVISSAPSPPPPPPQSASEPIPEYDYWKQKLAGRPVPEQAKRLVPELKPIFTQNGVPSELVWLAEVESSFNPRAKSPVGARGLYQFMPATAQEYGLRIQPIDQRLNPEKSADAASRYLRSLYHRFGDWPLAIAAYNAGGGRVHATLRKHGGREFKDIANHLPRETRMYVPKVFAAMAIRERISPLALPPAN